MLHEFKYQDSFDVKIDHRFSDKDSFSGRFSYGRSDTTLPGPFLNVPGSEPLIGQAAGTGGAGEFEWPSEQSGSGVSVCRRFTISAQRR